MRKHIGQRPKKKNSATILRRVSQKLLNIIEVPLHFLEEICEKWKCSENPIEAYIINGEEFMCTCARLSPLTLSQQRHPKQLSWIFIVQTEPNW